MHPNPIYRERTEDDALAFAAARAFGTLVVAAADGPALSHVPFLLGHGEKHVDLHLVRSNPIARMLEQPRPAVLAVVGPDGYISPDWYEVPDQVPTWNYVAVHLRGPLELRPAEELRDLLDRQSAEFEARLAPKPVWMPAKMSPEVLARMMRMIVPVRLHVEGIESTWKASQNKPEAVRLHAAEALEQSDFGLETGALATIMREG